ncbi:glycosyl transferase family 1 [Aestuariivivens sediminis]|uniref:glycosyl transferase family 1 n=1 Tax=Aestuariivivens sediminis TaxID=2913557 RepID=UPI001F5951A6|nr:glycosyl transferase family 1 [Aestuariivivens sediminis]
MGKKKVLIITYYWPPAGGPGVQRWLKFVKYLPDYGIEPVVYIPENPHYPIIDNTLVSEVSKTLTILRHPIKEPYKLASIFSKKTTTTISRGLISEHKKQNLLEKLMLYIRGNCYIPDARVGWVQPSVKFLVDYLEKSEIKTVITTGPPHSLHLIGLKLKNTTEIKWIADFRDPWTTIGYQKQLKLTNRSKQKHKILEKEVLNAADQIIVTSQVLKSEFESITTHPIALITNGFDYEPVTEINLDKKFTMSHIGSLLSKRNPEILWQVLSELIDENESFASHFQLNIVGIVSAEVLQSINKYNLINYLNNIGYVSHKESIKFQKQSQVLLLIEIDSEETRSIIPGKLFEYIVSNRPVIALGPKGSDTERILKETNTGQYYLYSEDKLLKEVILNYFESYEKGTLQTFGIGLQKYSRKSLTKALSNLI